MADPDWQGGHYYGTGRAPNAGMGVARMVGHITYLSAESIDEKFGRRLQNADEIRYSSTEPDFEVESYLRYQADSVRQALRRQHLSLHVARADLLRPGPAVRRRLARARGARRVGAHLLIAFSSDWLYPPAGSEELAAALRAKGKDVELHVIDAPYGHDCFLLEEARQTPMIRDFSRR